MIIKKDGKDYIDLAEIFSLSSAEANREDVEKNVWVALGLPLFVWPLTLVVILLVGITIAWLGKG